MSDRPGCLFPDCNKYVDARGLCANHYIRALTLVRAGRTTWPALEARGAAAPVRANKKRRVEDFFLGESPK